MEKCNAFKKLIPGTRINRLWTSITLINALGIGTTGYLLYNNVNILSLRIGSKAAVLETEWVRNEYQNALSVQVGVTNAVLDPNSNYWVASGHAPVFGIGIFHGKFRIIPLLDLSNDSTIVDLGIDKNNRFPIGSRIDTWQNPFNSN